MKYNNTFLSIQEFFLYNINFIDSITHVVYSILEMCYYAFTNVIENYCCPIKLQTRYR